MNLGVEIELALAEAGLGHFERARQQLQELLRMHTPNESAVTLGSIHEALARVALLSEDEGAAREQLGQALTLYKPLAVPSLVARARELERQMDAKWCLLRSAEATENGSRSTLAAALSAVVASGRALGGGCLEALVELLPADFALYVPANGERPLASRVDPSLEGDLLEWARAVLCALRDETMVAEDAAAKTIVAETTAPAPSEKVVGSLHFRPVPLWDAAQRVPLGFLLLGAKGAAPGAPEPDALRVLADCLSRSASL
jgi:hypothetical protein